MGVQDLCGRAGEGRSADQATKEDGTQRVNVGAPGHFATTCALFRRHIGGRPNSASYICQLRHIQGTRDAEIGQQWRHGQLFCCTISRVLAISRAADQDLFSFVNGRNGMTISRTAAERHWVDGT